MVWPLALLRMMLWIWLALILFRIWVEPPPALGMFTPVTTVGIVTVVWGALAALDTAGVEDWAEPLVTALATLDTAGVTGWAGPLATALAAALRAPETALVARLVAGAAIAAAAPAGL